MGAEKRLQRVLNRMGNKGKVILLTLMTERDEIQEALYKTTGTKGQFSNEELLDFMKK